MKSILRFCIPSLLLAVIVSISPEAYSDIQEEFHRKIEAEEGKTIEIDNINGTVTVSSWENDYVDVFALKKTRRGRDELDRVTIEIHNNEVLEIITVVDKYNPDEYSFFERLHLNTSAPVATF